MASKSTSKKYLDLYDNVTLTVNYTWGSWSGGQIKLTINNTKWSGLVTNKKGTLKCEAVLSDGTHRETETIYSGKTLFNVSSSATSGTGSGCSGSVTLTSSQLQSGSNALLEFTLSAGGRTYYYDLTIPAPSITYGQPSGSTSVTNITQTTADRRAVVSSWGTNASAGTWTWTYGPGNYNYNSGGSTNTTLKNLSANTTYNYKFYIKNKQGKTKTYTGTFKTKAYTPPTAYLSLNSVTNNSITMNFSSSGANVSKLRIYVNGSLWNTISAGNSGTFVVSGLAPKTTYSIQIQAYTSDGSLWGSTTGVVQGTTWPNPVSINTNGTYMVEILPFSAKVAVTSSNTSDTDSYGYTLLNANKTPITGEARIGSSTYNFTGLTPETTYYARVRVFTKVSGVASSYYDIPFTTPPDQASVFLKVNNVWKRGKVFLKTQDTWIKSKYIYTKVQGQWRKNNNF